MTSVAKAAIVVSALVLASVGAWYVFRPLEPWRSALDAEPVPSERLVLDGYDYDVYLLGRHQLVYQREGCVEAPATFFLHAVPLRQGDLPSPWSEHGFENLDFDFQEREGVRVGDFCVVEQKLPDYPVMRLRTGQYGSTSTSMEHYWAAIVDIGEAVPTTPFKVFRSGARGLVYKRPDCTLEDLRHPFHLRALPERVPGSSEVPPTGPDGYANLDFTQTLDDVQGEDGVCVFEREVPFAFRQLRTGQYDADSLYRYWQRDIRRG